MSGPKISYYGLSAEQKKILNAQWQCYRDTLASVAYVRNFADVMDARRYELLALQLKLNHMAETDAAYTASAMEISELAANLHDTCADFKAKAQNLKLPAVKRGKLDAATLETYRKTRARAIKLKEEAHAFNGRIDAAMETARDAVTRYEAGLYGDILQALETPAQPAAKPATDLASLDFRDIKLPEAATPDNRVPDMAKLKAALTDKLAPFAQNTALPAQLKAQIGGARLKLESINDLSFLKNFYAITIKPLLTESEHALTRHAKLTAEYRELYSRYLVLCRELDATPVPVELTSAALKELQGLMAEMEQAVLQDIEQAQVCNTIDAVMADMGYELLGRRQVTKKSGRRFKHELYTFAEGTAVDITYADDGQITMELGGLDYTDRMPDAAETEKLCKEMELFCTEFTTIEARLKERGVIVVNRVETASAAPEYAAIINLGEYELKQDQKVEVFSAQTPKRMTDEPKTQQKDLP